MFKRLFISLLILSALASEGVVNFPVNFYNMYLADVNKLNSCVDNEPKVLHQLQSNIKSPSVLNSYLVNTDEELFVLSRNSAALFLQYTPLEQKDFHSNYAIESLPANQEFFSDCSYVQPFNMGIGKEVIFKESDSSPPYRRV